MHLRCHLFSDVKCCLLFLTNHAPFRPLLDRSEKSRKKPLVNSINECFDFTFNVASCRFFMLLFLYSTIHTQSKSVLPKDRELLSFKQFN